MEKSSRMVGLTIAITWIFVLMMIAIGITAPYLFKWYANFFGRGERVFVAITSTYYSCLLPGIVAGANLLKLLYNIKKNQVFILENTRRILVLTLCCLVVGNITFVAGFFYFPFFIVSVAALFISLILGVIRNVFQKATEIKDENDLTI